jgi:hypothetical protein
MKKPLMRRMVRINIRFAFALVLISATLRAAPGQETVLQDINGVVHGAIERMTHAKWTVLFFLMADCPIANRYAPEIQRICAAYGPKGAECFLVYVDPSTTPAALQQHVKDYNFSCCPAILDSQHKLVRKAGATVSSEVAVFSNTGDLKYRGRIDNFNADLGSTRQRATQHDLRDALDALIAGRGIPNPRTQAIGCFIPE